MHHNLWCSVCKFISELVYVFVLNHLLTISHSLYFPFLRCHSVARLFAICCSYVVDQPNDFDGLSQVKYQMLSLIDRDWNECNALLQPNWNEHSHSILKPKLLKSKSQKSFICFTTVYPTITTWLLARLLFKTIIIIRIINYSMAQTVWWCIVTMVMSTGWWCIKDLIVSDY